MSSSAPERARRHRVTDLDYARQLHAGGWNDVEIVDQLAKRGVTVTKSTVGRWVKPHRHEAWRADHQRHSALKAAVRGRKPLGYPLARPEFKLARMQMLRDELHIGYRAIAEVMTFDFGEPITEDQVRYALATGRYPKRVQVLSA